MTARELLNAYPTIRSAVAWTELFVCTAEPGEPSAWDEMMRTGSTPAEVRDMLARALEEEVVEAAVGGHSARYRAQTVLGAAQARRPEFLTYIKGRMGAV